MRKPICQIKTGMIPRLRHDCINAALFTVKTCYNDAPLPICADHLPRYLGQRQHSQALVTVITGLKWTYTPTGEYVAIDPQTHLSDDAGGTS